MTKKVGFSKHAASITKNTQKQETVPESPVAHPSFGSEIDAFVFNVESLSRANHQTMKIITASTKDMAKKFAALVEEKGVVIKSEDGKTAYQIKPADAQVFKKRSR
ncbi:MAG: hypothetical protein QG552_1569, partial [Thermodesulfobacteriota bacterium]|nr:hypothetical protein [Thermodesulfobacteriota bacterium]